MSIMHPALIEFSLRIFRFIYSTWIAQNLNKVGRDPNIYYPFYLKGGRYITIGSTFIAGYRTRIEAWDSYAGERFNPIIKIGNNVCINYDCHFGAINHIEIGDNVLIGSRVTIVDHDHGTVDSVSLQMKPGNRPLVSKGPVIVEHDVWIGENVVILSNVTVGHNSIIGASSVVTKSVPPFSVIGGIPAKVIGSHG